MSEKGALSGLAAYIMCARSLCALERRTNQWVVPWNTHTHTHTHTFVQIFSLNVLAIKAGTVIGNDFFYLYNYNLVRHVSEKGCLSKYVLTITQENSKHTRSGSEKACSIKNIVYLNMNLGKKEFYSCYSYYRLSEARPSQTRVRTTKSVGSPT